MLLKFGQILVGCLQTPRKLEGFPVTDFRHLGQIALPLGLLLFGAKQFLRFLDLADGLDKVLFILPMGLHGKYLFLHFAQIGFEFRQPFPRNSIRFLFHGFPLDFQLDDLSLDFIDFGRHAVDFDTQLGSTFIHQIDGLVGQKPVGDIPVRQGDRRYNGRILDPNPMMDFIFFFEPPQNGDAVFHRRLFDQHRLKASFQSRIFFDILAVFVQGRSPHTAQGAAGQRGFEHVGCIHRTFGRPCPDQCVQLIDEEDHLTLGGLHFFQDGFQPIFEFPAVFGAGNERPHVERHKSSVFQCFGYITGHDPLSQPLDDGGFAHARLTDQYRVVFGAAGQDLHHPTDFIIPADNRVEFTQTGQIR